MNAPKNKRKKKTPQQTPSVRKASSISRKNKLMKALAIGLVALLGLALLLSYLPVT